MKWICKKCESPCVLEDTSSGECPMSTACPWPLTAKWKELPEDKENLLDKDFPSVELLKNILPKEE